MCGMRAATGFTVQEQRIARLVLAGLNNKEIALRLGISYNTVKSHMANMKVRNGLGNRIQVVTYYLEHYLEVYYDRDIYPIGQEGIVSRTELEKI